MSTFTKKILENGTGPTPKKGQQATVSADLYIAESGMLMIFLLKKLISICKANEGKRFGVRISRADSSFQRIVVGCRLLSNL